MIDPNYFFEQANRLLKEGRFSESKILFTKSENDFPYDKYPDTSYYKGIAHDQIGKILNN